MNQYKNKCIRYFWTTEVMSVLQGWRRKGNLANWAKVQTFDSACFCMFLGPFHSHIMTIMIIKFNRSKNVDIHISVWNTSIYEVHILNWTTLIVTLFNNILIWDETGIKATSWKCLHLFVVIRGNIVFGLLRLWRRLDPGYPSLKKDWQLIYENICDLQYEQYKMFFKRSQSPHSLH